MSNDERVEFATHLLFTNRQADAKVVMAVTKEDPYKYLPLPISLLEEAVKFYESTKQSNTENKRSSSTLNCEDGETTPRKAKNQKVVDLVSDDDNFNDDDDNDNDVYICGSPNIKFDQNKIDAVYKYREKYPDGQFKAGKVYDWRDTCTMALLFDLNAETWALFPWAQNCCGINSFIGSIFVTYVKAHDDITKRKVFETQAPILHFIMEEFRSGKITNIDAHEMILRLLGYTLNNNFLDLSEIAENIFQNVITIPNILRLNMNLFETICKYSTHCDQCIQNNPLINSSKLIVIKEVVMYLSCKSVEDTIKTNYNKSRNLNCDKCKNRFISKPEDLCLPLCIYVSYPNRWIPRRNGTREQLFEPDDYSLDSKVNINGITYLLCTCILGDGNHFIFNYDKNGTLHVADGLQRSTNGEYFEATSINTNKGLPFPMKSNKKTPNGLIYMRQ